MGEIIVQQFVTLDGVMQAPGDANEFELGGWQRQFISEDQLTVVTKQASEAGALLLGRKTYEGFAAAWPSATGMMGLADRMNIMPKYVISNTLKQAEWNAKVISGDAVEEVIKLKQQHDRDLLVLGSGNLIQTLIKHRLIDEFRIWMFPIVLGSGERLFRLGSEKINMSLVDTKTLSSGGVILTYRTINQIKF
ncbi:Dihydrofolate reductase [Paenibacillus sp. UNC496MF]|uniref:dihydrofolate reductase family protein n=1 Tax=Paenibacillus sp. UNC496MF TaxID=1502753 RepID=UPI0008E68611|nr:dihydrofolate reductase family protein [Paenibacillus sp. UNC496MF]SFI42422.1 Dihydrofolate reductase [Paenibacillus sp. UNC496MF]